MYKPYRDGGPAIIGWDITGLKVGTHIDGSINNPADTDKSWTVEVVLPLKALLKEWPGPRVLPKGGDKWRMDFSRVEWRIVTEDGHYKKEINPVTGKPYPEYNWVWSPQGRINMHMPEMWGYLQFSEMPAGSNMEAFVPDPDLDLKCHYGGLLCRNRIFRKHKSYSSSLEDIGLKKSDFPDSMPLPEILSTTTTFESFFPSSDNIRGWTIYQDGRIVNLNMKIMPDVSMTGF